jgi:hypothetical protein
MRCSRKGRWAMKRQQITRPAALLSVVAVVAAAGGVAAQAGTGAERRLNQVSAATGLPTCPSATICTFSGPDATGTRADFPASEFHSAWTNFDKAAGFHPASIINNSQSDIWVYDEDLEAGPYCAFGSGLKSYTFSDWTPVNGGTPSQGYTTQGYQPGWFFIQYNVNTCDTQPPPLPSQQLPGSLDSSPPNASTNRQ